MKLILRSAAAVTAFVAAALTESLVEAVQLAADPGVGQSPVEKAIELIANLEASLASDGQMEQKTYDKYMCWCEATLVRKMQDIKAGKDKLAKLEKLIPRTGAEIASLSADTSQLRNDIAANQNAQREATEVRQSENSAYADAKAESESSVGSLEAASTALAGAGNKKGFLQSIKQAQLISVAAGMKQLIEKVDIARSASTVDVAILRRFVERPTDFLGSGANEQASALELSAQSGQNNPFGDFAPQSTQIQGILKNLYDGFVSDMEKDHGIEADKQKAFEELMATKANELANLQSELQQHEEVEAKKAKLLADSKMERDDTGRWLKADKAFYSETKSGCQQKSHEWSQRSQLRTEEMIGIGEALKIFRDPENQAILSRSAATFVQLSSLTVSASSGTSRVFSRQQQQQRQLQKQQRQRIAMARAALGVRRAHNQLSALARKLNSMAVARIAAQARGGGHFNQVMILIDQRVADLRKQEQRDIEHRDRCESAEAKSANDIEDLAHVAGKAHSDIEKLDGQISDLEQKVVDFEAEIHQTDGELADLRRFRGEEEKEFKQSLKDDALAVQIIKQAMAAMAKFYKNNRIDMSLLGHAQEPEYTIDRDKAPETAWDSSEQYGGRRSQTRGALGALESVVSNIKEEMVMAQKYNMDEEEQFEAAKADLQELRDKAEKAKLEVEKRVADLEEKRVDTAEKKADVGNELAAENALQDSIASDCAWVKNHFDSRRAARKSEINGLQDAKSMLAGAEQGDFDELVVFGSED